MDQKPRQGENLSKEGIRRVHEGQHFVESDAVTDPGVRNSMRERRWSVTCNKATTASSP